MESRATSSCWSWPCWPAGTREGPKALRAKASGLFCIGCGRIDVAEPCLGACDERVLDLVLAKDHDEGLVQVAKVVQHAGMLRQLLRQLVANMPEPNAPMPDDWTDTHRAMQAQARSVLHEMEPSEALEEVDPNHRVAVCHLRLD